MSLEPNELRELKDLIADRLYLQVEKWHLYFGDAGLAEALALECNVNLHQGASTAARKALEAVQVNVGGNTTLPVARFVTPSQLFDLEEIVQPYCR